MRDSNPAYDPGAPRSIGGTNDAAKLCDIVEIDLNIQAVHEQYFHRWGEACYDIRAVVRVWELAILDINGKPCTI